MSSYVLITAAHNEESFIEKTLASVVNQSLRPVKWVIVNDRSTDKTEEIIRQYQLENNFIELMTVRGDDNRNFGAQVRAINNGFDLIRHLDYDFIGNLDADISFEPCYFEQLLKAFGNDARLGLAGGTIYEQQGGKFKLRKTNQQRSVPHAVQMFRRACYEAVGGYRPLRYGGPDSYAEVTARMLGWQVRSIPELQVFHHRATASADGLVRGAIRQGFMDYSLGSLPLFELMKCIRRMQTKPYVAGGLIRFAAFLWATCRMEQREASREFVKYLRMEQGLRLRAAISRWYL